MPFTFKLSQRLARMRLPQFVAPAMALAIAAFVACDVPSRPKVDQASQIALSPRSLTLEQNQTADFEAIAFTSAGDTAANVVVVWSVTGGLISDRYSINGRHYIRYRAGVDTGTIKLTVRVTPGTTGDTAVVTVTNVEVAQVMVTPGATSLPVGQATQFFATPTDASGNPVSGSEVTWSTSNTSVASVSASGLVRGVSTGNAKIKVTSHGHSGSSDIAVTVAPVASVTVTPASASGAVGQAVQLAATPKDASGTPLSGRVVTWATSNVAVATVNGSGLVSGVAAGVATITATSEGQSGGATITVTVVPVASVTVSPATASAQVGQTVQLTATPKDAGGSPLAGRAVTWTTSNASIATVSAAGLVSAVAAGRGTITGPGEGKTGTATVTVTAPPPPPPPPPPVTPGTVTDLTVSAATDSTLTLSFTEVSDGTGVPANYDIRWAAGSISWPTAADVTRGSCSVPMAGTAIGARRNCTGLGLTSGTGDQFQLVAFRGTLNVNAVFGGLSPVATGTTVSSSAPVATVTVAPTSASVVLAGLQQFTALLKDASGNTLTGRGVTWTSSAPLVATGSGARLAPRPVVGTGPP